MRDGIHSSVPCRQRRTSTANKSRQEDRLLCLPEESSDRVCHWQYLSQEQQSATWEAHVMLRVVKDAEKGESVYSQAEDQRKSILVCAVLVVRQKLFTRHLTKK